MGHREVTLRGARSGETHIALVDESVSEDILKAKWHLATDGYARRKASKKERENGSPFFIAMHRQMMGMHLSKGAVGSP